MFLTEEGGGEENVCVEGSAVNADYRCWILTEESSAPVRQSRVVSIEGELSIFDRSKFKFQIGSSH